MAVVNAREPRLIDAPSTQIRSAQIASHPVLPSSIFSFFGVGFGFFSFFGFFPAFSRAFSFSRLLESLWSCDLILSSYSNRSGDGGGSSSFWPISSYEPEPAPDRTFFRKSVDGLGKPSHVGMLGSF